MLSGNRTKVKIINQKYLFQAVFVFAVLGLLFTLGQIPVANVLSKELGVYNLSPLGQNGGRIIPASCPSDMHDDPLYGLICSVSNQCGKLNYGLYQCGGVCSVNSAPLPSGYGSQCESSANICGMTSNGAIDCSETCNATIPPDSLCNTCGNGICDPTENFSNCPLDCPGSGVSSGGTCPNGSPIPANGVCPTGGGGGGVCSDGLPVPPSGVCPGGGPATCPNGSPVPPGGVCPNSTCAIDNFCASNETVASCPGDCADIPITIIEGIFTITPNPVLINKSVFLNWEVEGATACVITGVYVSGQQIDNFVAGKKGNKDSPKLMEDTDFTLYCSNNRGGADSKTIRVRVLNPQFQEF